jgi:hypothetical protein
MGSLGPLNLADADLKGFEAVEPGRYNAEVFAITMDAIKNTSGEGKMPAGTPMMKVQFKLTDEGVENRRVFTQYVIPPTDYDAKKAATMKGMIARFFIALGETEEAVRSKKFDPEFDNYVGRPCVVVLSKEEYNGEWQNRVKGVKPAGEGATGAGQSGLL